MNMRKRRKHCVHILGRNPWFRSMWALGMKPRHGFFGRYCFSYTAW